MDSVEVIGCEPVGKGKLRVKFSDGITCLLYRGEARTYRIQEHASLSYRQYEDLMKNTLGKRAKKRTMHLLEQMDRTEYQLRDKLAQGGYPAECIDDAVAYVKEYHYLDIFKCVSELKFLLKLPNYKQKTIESFGRQNQKDSCGRA